MYEVERFIWVQSFGEFVCDQLGLWLWSMEVKTHGNLEAKKEKKRLESSCDFTGHSVDLTCEVLSLSYNYNASLGTKSLGDFVGPNGMFTKLQKPFSMPSEFI